ncbi:hypothetical protein Cst04h_16850 [Corynebacterium striatum]|uniref:Uncharacterized protein n=1 Tax=Corynebacterium striatum TaxID=43770 RepID=A0ABC9ZNN5_CORST|nr:hypothetical protein Cst04h_16850 [Corynebacterium striatum]
MRPCKPAASAISASKSSSMNLEPEFQSPETHYMQEGPHPADAKGEALPMLEAIGYFRSVN